MALCKQFFIFDLDCPVGKYCPKGSKSPINCPDGTFSTRKGKHIKNYIFSTYHSRYLVSLLEQNRKQVSNELHKPS